MAITLENGKRKTENGKKPEAGFALLIAVIFMSVMLSFGLALGSLGYKQQVLASSAIESQYAFYVADAALECALYSDQQNNQQGSLFTYSPDATTAPLLSCGGATIASGYPLLPSRTANQWILTYRLSYDTDKRCADVTVYKPNGAGTTYLFSQGYNVSCSAVGTNPRFVSRGLSTHYSSSAQPPPPLTCGTGGTVTESGGYCIHTFTSVGTFTPPSSVTSVDYLVVAGGGGGGGGVNASGGGGGAGGMLTGSISVTAQAYPITVGAGGAKGVSVALGDNGGNSVFSTITATGGGGGGNYYSGPGQTGGSGGGGPSSSNTSPGSYIAGQGMPGGAGSVEYIYYSSGGGGGRGGSGGASYDWNASVAGAGGSGAASSISGVSTYYAGGGGGASYNGTSALGGIGGGGAGGFAGTANGTANTGGGGGGMSPNGGGGGGGSGIVIIRYLKP